jgi:hypothetical protein
VNELAWFRSHVERLLQSIWESTDVVPDDDGDYPFRFGTAACWVRVEPAPWMAVRITAHVARGVNRSARLLRELNDIGAHTRFGSVYLSNGIVVCDYALPAPAVDIDTLEWACRAVGTQADELGAVLAAVYDGKTPFAAESLPEGSSEHDSP